MFSLTRRVGQCVWVGDNIRVIVEAVDRDHVRLAFDSPAELPIQRDELRTVTFPRETGPSARHNRAA